MIDSGRDFAAGELEKWERCSFVGSPVWGTEAERSLGSLLCSPASLPVAELLSCRAAASLGAHSCLDRTLTSPEG